MSPVEGILTKLGWSHRRISRLPVLVSVARREPDTRRDLEERLGTALASLATSDSGDGPVQLGHPLPTSRPDSEPGGVAIVDLGRWLGLLTSELELSDTGSALQVLGAGVGPSRASPTPSAGHREVQPAETVLYLHLLLRADRLLPALAVALADADVEHPTAESPSIDGLLVAAVYLMSGAAGAGGDPREALDLLEWNEWREALAAKPRNLRGALTGRLTMLAELGLLHGEELRNGVGDFATLSFTAAGRAVVGEWRGLLSTPEVMHEYLEREFFSSMARVYARERAVPIESERERLLWFVRAFGEIGREIGFTPGRPVALLACLLAWEEDRIMEMGEVFDAALGTTDSELGDFFHLSGGSRFDREFLIRVDDEALRVLEDTNPATE